MNFRHPIHAHRSRQSGLTMIEIMVALAIGLLLTAGAIQIFVSSKQAYRATEALSRVQENGRYALHFLAKDIRGASFWGCAQDVEVNNLIDGGASPPFDFGDEPIKGTEGASGAPDSITLRFASQTSGISVNKQMPKTAANLFLTSVAGIAAGDVMIITDCESADIFAVTGTNPNNDNLGHNSGSNSFPYQNTTQKLSKTYGVGAMAFNATERTFSIAGNTLQRTINGNTETLVDGIEDLQIDYGVDTDNDQTVNTYVAADVIDTNASLDWDKVVAVRVAVTARSAETNVAEDDGTGDGRARKTFTRTIGVRNRLE